MAPGQRFSAKMDHEIPCGGHSRLTLRPIDENTAESLGHQISQIAPWQTLGIAAPALAQSLTQSDQGAFKRALWLEGGCVGAVRIQDPWLYGPYLALLALLPGAQGKGLGTAVLECIESEIRGTSSNIWACVSSFNTDAQRFYARHGFETIGVIPDLLRPGFSEVLIRKHLR